VTKHAILIGSILAAAGAAQADTIIVPMAAAGTGGNGAYSTVLHSQPRSYQVVIGQQHLAGLPSGSIITGIQSRLASWQAFPSWPATVASFANFDITLSKSNNPGGSLSSTYTDNIGSDAVLVRNGPINFSAGAFPGGAISPSFNAWSTVIPCVNTYTYTGGDLLITIRHTGSGSSNGNLDWIAGAGCQAIGVSSYTQSDNWYAQGNGGSIAFQLTFTAGGAPCYANCDGSTTPPILNVLDFVCFQTAFAQGSSTANCDGSTSPPVLNVLDFVCFQTRYAQGCP
jgi:hypothetical protein